MMAPSRISDRRRQQVAERARHRCEYCLSPLDFSSSAFVVDHVRPWSISRDNSLANLAFACRGCNEAKADRTHGIDPPDGDSVRLFNPRADHRPEHFAWAEGYTLLVGLSAVGRVTVNTLDLNRPGLRNQRRLLHLFGVHPPVEEVSLPEV